MQAHKKEKQLRRNAKLFFHIQTLFVKSFM